MHLTPIRLTVLALPALLAVAVASGGCGQVTGLSDDYVYDLEAGASADGGGDAAKTDGAADGAVDAGVDATNKCSAGQTAKAAQKLTSYNGTQLCKTCLATSCCNDVDTCASNGDCNHVLSCKLDCTEKSLTERSQCFKSCTVSGQPSSLYQSTVGSCAPAACTKECGLQ